MPAVLRSNSWLTHFGVALRAWLQQRVLTFYGTLCGGNTLCVRLIEQPPVYETNIFGSILMLVFGTVFTVIGCRGLWDLLRFALGQTEVPLSPLVQGCVVGLAYLCDGRR